MNSLLRPAEIAPQRVPMTVEALRLLDDQGYFNGAQGRYELIDGDLVMTPSPGSSHQKAERNTNTALMTAILTGPLKGQLAVQHGGGFRIGDTTLLQPDVMVVRATNEAVEFSADAIIVLIEIAWSSHTFDTGAKAQMYARAGIADYWVLDVPSGTVIVHREPGPDGYGRVETHAAGSHLTAALEPKLTVAVADLF